MSELKPHVVLLNETKLCESRRLGFQTAALRDRTVDKTHVGGVCILVSNTVTYSDISLDMDDVVATEVRAGASVFAIVSYYCPPDGRDLNSAMLERYVLKYERVIVAGDLNAKHQFYGSKCTNARGDELFDFVERNNLIVLNDPEEMTHQAACTGQWDLIDYFVVSR